jgi:hypothetical protein
LLVILFYTCVEGTVCFSSKLGQFYLEGTIHQIEKDRERSFLVICAIELHARFAWSVFVYECLARCGTCTNDAYKCTGTAAWGRRDPAGCQTASSMLSDVTALKSDIYFSKFLWYS